MQRAEDEYIIEKESASRELEEKKIELQENLISELEEKKRHVETERITIELTGDSMEVSWSFRVYASFLFISASINVLQIKAPTTRKLRRRPNDPINVNSSTGSSDKRRKMAPAQLAYLLDENDVVDDLRAIERGISGPPSTKNSGNGPSIRGNNGVSNKRSNYSSPARHSDQSPSR